MTITITEKNYRDLEFLAFTRETSIEDVANELIARALANKARPTAVWPPKTEQRLKGVT